MGIKNIIILFFLSFFIFSYSYANECKYTSKIEKCDEEIAKLNKNSNDIIPWASLRHITDFTCLQDSKEQRAYQIIMEEKFNLVDEQMENYLKILDSSKDLYFSADSELTYMDWLASIWKSTNTFKDSYYNACSSSISELAMCVWDWSIPVLGTKDFLKWWDWDCYKLADIKVNIFREVAYNVLILNKKAIIQDGKKLYEQELRTRYDNLLDLLMVNIWYAERIRKKWPTKISNVIK